MKLFPAVDILDNKAVRLLEGKRDLATVYGHPLDMAHQWADMGAKYLHIVDLNAAFGENYKNEDLLRRIAKEINAVIQLGGGMRTLDRIKYALDELGFDRVIVGSAVITNPDMIEGAAKLYGNKIVAGLDSREGKLSIKGWTEQSAVTPFEAALRLKQMGVEDIVFTDISRDGKLTGVNADATKELQGKSGLNVIASGGISRMEDLLSLKQKGIYGAITGKAIYEKTIDLREALNICE